MFRRALFQVHWLFGITAGLVLALMGVTGAMMAFEDEIMAALSPGIATVAPPPGAQRLAPDALLAAIGRQAPGREVAALIVATAPEQSATVLFERPLGNDPATRRSFVDPYSGRLLGAPNGRAFFDTVRALHRWLLLPGNGNGAGRQITAIAAIALIFFALSGLWLRWPRRPLDWRNWFVIGFRRRGRSLNRALHAVIGTWLLPFYLLSGLTGLWWSYQWYRSAATVVLTGKAPEPREQASRAPGGKKAPKPPLPLAPAFAAITRDTGGRFELASLSLPRGTKPVRIRVLPSDATHAQAFDDYRVDPVSGRIVSRTRYRDLATGAAMAGGMLAVHRGAYWGLPGRIAMLLASAAMPLFAVTGWLLYLDRRRRKRALGAIETGTTAPITTLGSEGVLVAHASQTGTAIRLARLTAAGFADAGRPVAVRPLASLAVADLAGISTLLVVASTYGEGEPPDTARGFPRLADAFAPGALAGLSYAVLALGDRHYADFCAFGAQVDGQLHAAGAARLFDRIEVDKEDPEALRHWQQQTIAIGATFNEADWVDADYAPWRLVERRLLNQGSPGEPAWHIALEPVGVLPDWQAGDIAEIVPEAVGQGIPQAPVRHREYSIASLPGTGRVELLVRLRLHVDGTHGLGSGWLIERAPLGTVMPLRIRDNQSFRPAAEERRAILIGSGTGLAGLLAHLRDRRARGLKSAWLIFGERSAAHDFFHRAEIEAMQADGTLVRVDLAFSREGSERRYVQHRVAEAKAEIRAWVEGSAEILVCGSLAKMAPAVDRTLREILGDQPLEQMAANGRYRRDIY